MVTTILSEKTVAGQIDAADPNTIHGWLQLAQRAQPLILHLTGNAASPLRGRQIYFQAEKFLDWQAGNNGLAERRESERVLASHQIGPLFDFRMIGVDREESEIPPDRPFEAGVRLEWSSQDGLVLIELDRAIVEVGDRWHGPGRMRPSQDDRGGALADRKVVSSATSIRQDEPLSSDMMAQLNRTVDQKVQDHFDLVDEMINGQHDVPLESLFDPPLRLVVPRELDDSAIQRELLLLLARLAEVGIGLEMCEHFTARQAYQLLLDEILQQDVFPRLKETGFLQQFTTYEYCSICYAETDRKLNAQ